MLGKLQHSSLGALAFRHGCLQDAAAIFTLESESFPADERASIESIHLRLTEAHDYFLVVEHSCAIVGYVNGTCVEDEDFGHESMTSHCSQGKHLVIHSVTVHPRYRRQRIGLMMLRKYVQILLNRSHLDSVLLLTKAYLLGFYSSAGFSFKRPSNIIHGQVNKRIKSKRDRNL